VELSLPMWEGEAPAESRLRRSVALPKQNPNDRNIHAITTLAPPRATLSLNFPGLLAWLALQSHVFGECLRSCLLLAANAVHVHP